MVNLNLFAKLWLKAFHLYSTITNIVWCFTKTWDTSKAEDLFGFLLTELTALCYCCYQNKYANLLFNSIESVKNKNTFLLCNLNGNVFEHCIFSYT